jgi:hypothetical protein
MSCFRLPLRYCCLGVILTWGTVLERSGYDIPHNSRSVMTPERLHRIRAVYKAAVDSPAGGRQALLDHECEGDELRQEVQRLLGTREHLPEWLAGSVLGVAHGAVLEADSQ